MIPIASSTYLSNKRTAELLQSLIDLKDQNVDFPIQISESIEAYANNAQQIFLSEIDDYLHGSCREYDIIYNNHEDEDEMNFKIVKTIVESYPEFLATMDPYGCLPCHYAARFDNALYLKLYIDVGIKHGIGGEDMRGGLYVSDGIDDTLCTIKDSELLEMLRQMTPPSFCIEDVRKYHLLHNTILVNRANVGMVKYFITLDPSSVHQRNESNRLPIQCVDWDFSSNEEGREIVQCLIKASLLHPPSDKSIGSLFEKMPNDVDFTITHLVDQAGMEGAWDCIEKSFSKYKQGKNLPCILHQTIKNTPQYCSEVIKRFPASVHVHDKNNMNRLPIHVALETGMVWSLALEYLIATSQEYLKDVDPVTKWPPFVLAGMGTGCDLRVIYDLLHKHPEHVERSDDSSGYKFISLENNHKRRKIKG